MVHRVLASQGIPSSRIAGAFLVAAALAACGGGGGKATATVSSTSVSASRYASPVLLTINGTSLADKVTFATINVFGRNLNSIAKAEARAGRDHYGNHAVMVMIGKNIKPGVIGGLTTPASGNALQASDIDSATGTAKAGGDIPAAQTHVAAARTLGVALGIPSAQLDTDFITGAGGKVVNAALNGVSG